MATPPHLHLALHPPPHLPISDEKSKPLHQYPPRRAPALSAARLPSWNPIRMRRPFPHLRCLSVHAPARSGVVDIWTRMMIRSGVTAKNYLGHLHRLNSNSPFWLLPIHPFLYPHRASLPPLPPPLPLPPMLLHHLHQLLIEFHTTQMQMMTKPLETTSTVVTMMTSTRRSINHVRTRRS